jgi:ABC transporter with metal-binding/Fe-S-binding domain ATP-binding protein
MKVAALFSGGKDSIFAIYIAKLWGWDISHLVTLYPKKNHSWMFHSINIHLTEKLSKSIDISLIKKQTEGKKEEELEDLKEILSNLEIDGVISGAIASEYQRTRIEKICHELGTKSFTPLWHKNQELILREQIKAGFKIIIVGVFANGFNESWLGATIDEKSINELVQLGNKFEINLAGEGGEFETLTLNGPIFKKELVIDDVIKEWKRDNGILVIKKSHLK